VAKRNQKSRAEDFTMKVAKFTKCRGGFETRPSAALRINSGGYLGQFTKIKPGFPRARE